MIAETIKLFQPQCNILIIKNILILRFLFLLSISIKQIIYFNLIKLNPNLHSIQNCQLEMKKGKKLNFLKCPNLVDLKQRKINRIINLFI